MPEPIGDDSYKGLGSPLFGDATIEQRNSSNYVRLYVHTSDNLGGFLGFSDFRADRASTVLTNLLVADVDVDGGFRSLSGTTVQFELNSSGLYDGTTQIIADGGIFVGGARKQTVTINTTASTLVSSNSGKMHVLSTQAATSNFIMLPTAANVTAGDSWDIISNTTAGSLWNIVVNGTSGRIEAGLGTTAAIGTTGAVTHDTSGGFWVSVVCLSTVLPTYALRNNLAHNNGTSGSFPLSLSAGTTA